MTKQDLYDLYQAYCKMIKKPPLSAAKFYKDILKELKDTRTTGNFLNIWITC